MAYGIKVYNIRDRVVVDSELVNYVFQESGSWTRDTTGAPVEDDDRQPITFASAIAAADGPPLVVLRPTSSSTYFRAIVYGYIYSGGNWTGFNLHWGYSAGGKDKTDTVYWAVFRRCSDADLTSDGYGMELFDASGNLTWTSNKRTLKIVEVYDPYNVAGHMPQNIDPPVSTDNYFSLTPNLFEFDGLGVSLGAKASGFLVSPSLNKVALPYAGVALLGQGDGSVWPVVLEVTW